METFLFLNTETKDIMPSRVTNVTLQTAFPQGSYIHLYVHHLYTLTEK